MTADFFGATLAMSSYDLQEKIDHGKEEQVEETCSGKGQASRGQEERCKKESRASEGEGEGGCEEGDQSCAQEGQAQSQGCGQEACAQASSGSAGRTGTRSGTVLDAGRRHADIAAASEYRTDGVLEIRRREL
jgi:hypothetical protein